MGPLRHTCNAESKQADTADSSVIEDTNTIANTNSKISGLLSIFSIVFAYVFCYEKGPWIFLFFFYFEVAVHITLNAITIYLKTHFWAQTINAIRVFLICCFHYIVQLHYGYDCPLYISSVYKIIMISNVFYSRYLFILVCSTCIIFTSLISLYHCYLISDKYQDNHFNFGYKITEIILTQYLVAATSKLYIDSMTQQKTQNFNQKMEIEKEKLLNSAKTKFIGNLSHECRNPINVILGAIQLFRMNQTNNCITPCDHCVHFDESIKELLQDIDENANLLLSVFSTSLQMSSLELGNINLKINRFNLLSLFEGMISVFSPLAIQKNIALCSYFDIKSVPVHLYGDKIRISQILMNIISNAIKYTNESGTVSVRCELCDNNDLEEHMFEKTEDISYISIECSDNGKGIEQTDIEQLFQPFHTIGNDNMFEQYYTQQSDKENSSSVLLQNRNGLGLSICKLLVDKMNGKISVKSKLKEGTTMKIILPLKKSNLDDRIEEENFFTNEESKYLNLTNFLCKFNEETPYEEKFNFLILDDEKSLRNVVFGYVNMLIGKKIAHVYSCSIDEINVYIEKNGRKDAKNLIIICDENQYIVLNDQFKLDKTVTIIPTTVRGFSRKFKCKYISKPVKFIEMVETLSTILFLNNKPSGSDKLEILYSNTNANNEIEEITNLIETTQNAALVVDDNLINLKILKKMLEIIGFKTVDTACNGMECFEKVKHKKYDIVLLDCLMPVCNGVQACEMIRNYEQDCNSKRVPILAITANVWEDKKDLIEKGFDSVLFKPILLDSLKAEIEKICASKTTE
ncbi:hypothetical protein ABK040_002668 [Willaertia magna]